MAPTKVFSLSSLMGNSSSREKAKSTPLSPVPAPPVTNSSPYRTLSRNGHTPSRPLPNAQPPLLNVTHETPPELQPIFTFLSNHSKKLYTEGYFLKLTDLNPDGKPHTSRQWMECYAQLVGTVLSLWEAAALDSAGENEEVVPTFLNLTDASIRMIDTLPTKSADTPTLRNVLSISTAKKNRYLLYFNSHHSLTQWTAGIRLALFELAMLQEAYTGALISSKGKSINGINNLMQRTRFKYEDWARVRFAAGEPWNKYWAVITPPDEKLYQKWKKEIKKGKQSREPLVLGNIKFYATKKTKKATPVATITKVYSCYAIYPQSEALIEHSTLVKIEGQLTTENASEPREGFVFVMPDTHPSVSGFEMMIRWLFPAFDAFHLYGRPERLAADVTDMRSLMFAMPREAKYGYLEVADVANLISADKQKKFSEMDWRRKLKELTLKKMQEVQKVPRDSLPAQSKVSTIIFNDNRSSTSSSPAVPYPPQHVPLTPSIPLFGKHNRSMSEAQGYVSYHDQTTVGNSPHERPSTASAIQHHGSDFRSSVHGVGSEVHSDEDDGELFANFNTLSTRYPKLDLPKDIPSTPIMAHVPSSRPAHPLPPTPGFQSRMSMATLQTLVQGSVVSSAYQHGNNRQNHDDDTEDYSDRPPRPSYESNMFEDLPIRRPEWTSTTSLGAESATQWSSASRSYTPSPHHPLPPPPLEDTKISTRRRSHSPPPPDPPRHLYYNSVEGSRPTSKELASPQNNDQIKFSWGPENDELRPSVANRPSQLDLSQGSTMMPPLPSPPVPAKIPFKANNAPQPPALRTKNIASSNDVSSIQTPHSTDSLGSLANHVMNTEALNRVSQQMARPTSQEDMSELSRATKIARTFSESDSGSEYGNDETDDYASTDEEHEPVKPPPRAEGARAGVMRTVGQRNAGDITIGDSHYRSGIPPSEVESNVPKVDFGRTFNHGRSLSTGTTLGQPSSQAKAVSRGHGKITDSVHGIHSEHASPVEYMKGTTQQNLDGSLVGAGHKRNPSTGSSYVFDDTKRSPHLRQYSSPEPGDGKGSQVVSHNKLPSTGRKMAWQPGLVQTGGNSKFVARSETPEGYVAEQAAAAKQQSQARNRYVHSRRPSRNSSAEQIPRPPSRAFSPHGLINTPDLSSHLSAREQEYIARRTGTTLLQMEEGKIRKQPPHQAGLLGALEAREKEKQDLTKSGVSNNVTVQQALAQRQLHSRTVSSSNRGVGEAMGRISSQQYQQSPISQQPLAQPDSIPPHPQPGYGQYQQQSHGIYFGHGNQGGHGQYNGR